MQGHEGGTSRALQSELIPQGLTDAVKQAVKRADHRASAADRAAFPKHDDDGRHPRWQRVEFHKKPVIIHPLTSRQIDLKKLTSVEPAQAEALSLDHFLKLVHGNDLRKTRRLFRIRTRSRERILHHPDQMSRPPPRRLLAITLSALLLAGCGQSSAPDLDDIEPRLQTDPALLDAALRCTPFTHPDTPAVLLVHGTFLSGYEQWDWTFVPLLSERGFDVCTITYPDRGLGDMQTSAEYVVYALRRMHDLTGRKVAMIGHSQGAVMPRWALKWWPSAREATEDFVMLAGPSHGSVVALPVDPLLETLGLSSLPVGLLPEFYLQFARDSDFITALNRGDETPGDVDYTSLYTLFDEVVQPQVPVSTSALDDGKGNPRVTNLLLQDLCPGRVVDHGTIGLTDRLAFELTLDAIANPGPTDIERAGGTALCGLLSIVPDQIVATPEAAALLNIVRQAIEAGLPAPHLASAEPPLREYAQP